MSGRQTYLRAYVALLIILVLACGFVYEVYSLIGVPKAPVESQTLPQYPSDLPALQAQDSVSQQQPFQYLVSYTASGFRPTTLSVKSGEVVRFINNSQDPVTLSGAAGATTPLAHGAYFQWTAAKHGTAVFVIGNSTLTITVQ